MNSVDLKRKVISKELLRKVPSRVAVHYQLLPIAEAGDRLEVCVPPDFDTRLKDEVRVVLNQEVSFLHASRESILEAIRAHYGLADEMIARIITQSGETKATGSPQETQGLEEGREPSVERLVNDLILDALDQDATDIHLEPFEHRLSVRYRVDGLLKEAGISERVRWLTPNIISRIKIMAHLDIGEKRLPQDGRIKVKVRGTELDLRVSVLPTSCGEAVVIRVLGAAELLDLGGLGFSAKSVGMIRQILKKPHGIVLLTGPTGSGKTTTLYSILKEMNTTARKIITVEDPVEYKMSGLLQMQVKPQIDLTFSKALRAMLRHDPDVLMVGEIRDEETAEIAIRSALTGHLVFSTLHTNDAPSALTRLLEMGIAPYLIASSVELVIAQRLVRKLCVVCRRKENGRFLADGCDACGGTGFHGREAVEEILWVNDEIRREVLQGVSSDILREAARRAGWRPLRERGLEKIQEGVTALEELERVC